MDRLAAFEDPFEAFWSYHKAMFRDEKTGMEFRRPETHAKDGVPCRFIFYHKGTEPAGEYEVH
jgi:hypothetical protein